MKKTLFFVFFFQISFWAAAADAQSIVQNIEHNRAQLTALEEKTQTEIAAKKRELEIRTRGKIDIIAVAPYTAAENGPDGKPSASAKELRESIIQKEKQLAESELDEYIKAKGQSAAAERERILSNMQNSLEVLRTAVFTASTRDGSLKLELEPSGAAAQGWQGIVYSTFFAENGLFYTPFVLPAAALTGPDPEAVLTYRVKTGAGEGEYVVTPEKCVIGEAESGRTLLTIAGEKIAIPVTVRTAAAVAVQNVKEGSATAGAGLSIKAPGSPAAGSSVQLAAADGTGKAPQVSWFLSGNSDPATRVSADGTVFAGKNELLYELTVRAVSAADKTKSAVITFGKKLPAGMVLVPGGTFRRSENATVTVSPFFMGAYEVTQAEYRAVTGKNPSGFKGDNLPVENISWYEAAEYCNLRSIREGLSPAYVIDKTQKDPGNLYPYDDQKWTVTRNTDANGYRLPTEAEWEFAARGGFYYRGEQYCGSDTLDEVAWNEANSRGTTHAGGLLKPNRFGLYDMSGNVWEWCQDWYDEYPAGNPVNPAGAEKGRQRLYRGGSWAAFGDAAINYRKSNYPSITANTVGLRVVRNIN